MLYTERDARMSEFQRENRRRTRRYAIVFACLFFVLLLIFYANVSVGTVALRADLVSQTILWRIRLPRVCLAMILGGALALSGFLLQTFFENPIAGPYILGISSGAKLTVTLSMPKQYVEKTRSGSRRSRPIPRSRSTRSDRSKRTGRTTRSASTLRSMTGRRR